MSNYDRDDMAIDPHIHHAQQRALEAALARVVAYLNEIERVNKANDYKRSSYADEVHAINDFEIRRSDLLLILGADE